MAKHTYAHTYMHIQVHIYAQIQAHIHTHTHIRTYTNTHANTHTCTYAQIQAHIRAQTCSHMQIWEGRTAFSSPRMGGTASRHIVSLLNTCHVMRRETRPDRKDSHCS